MDRRPRVLPLIFPPVSDKGKVVQISHGETCSKIYEGELSLSLISIDNDFLIHGFQNSTVRLKTRDYSKFPCLFT